MKKIIKNIIIVVSVIFIWSILDNYLPPLFLPSIKNTINDFLNMLFNGTLIQSIIKSFTRITIATSISCVISIILALLICSNKLLDSLITPITNVMRYIPVTAFSPLLILWVGIDETMKIAFLFCATFFNFLPAIILCIKEIDQRLIETAKTMGMSKFQIIIKVIVPYTLPSICENILMMYSIGWTYIVIAEQTNAVQGLGYIINIGSARGRTSMVFMAIIIIMIISAIIDTVGKKIIRKVFKWKYSKEEII